MKRVIHTSGDTFLSVYLLHEWCPLEFQHGSADLTFSCSSVASYLTYKNEIASIFILYDIYFNPRKFLPP